MPKIFVAAAAAIAAGLLAVGCATAAPSQAATSHHTSAQATTVKGPWTCTKAGACRTCTPGSKLYIGAYRVFDNAWIGPSSEDFCVRSTGLNIAIDSNAVSDGPVVAYPSIRFGPFFTDGDPQYGGPWRVTRIGRMTLHVASTGHAAGNWQSDADLWFRPKARWTKNGTYEVVIVNYSTTRAARGAFLTRVRGVRYWYLPWITCQRTSSSTRTALAHGISPLAASRPVLASDTPQAIAAAGCASSVRPWTILLFWKARQQHAVAFHVGNFVWHAIHMRYLRLPRDWWLGDAAYGTELWSGGKGLTDSMRVTGLHA